MSLGGVRRANPLLIPVLIFPRRFSSRDTQVLLAGLSKALRARGGVRLPFQLQAASVLLTAFSTAILSMNFKLFRWDADAGPKPVRLSIPRQTWPAPPPLHLPHPVDAEV